MHAAQLEEEEAATSAFRAVRRRLRRVVRAEALAARQSGAGVRPPTGTRDGGGGGSVGSGQRLSGALTVGAGGGRGGLGSGLRAVLARRRAAVLRHQAHLHGLLGTAALNLADPEQVRAAGGGRVLTGTHTQDPPPSQILLLDECAHYGRYAIAASGWM